MRHAFNDQFHIKIKCLGHMSPAQFIFQNCMFSCLFYTRISNLKMNIQNDVAVLCSLDIPMNRIFLKRIKEKTNEHWTWKINIDILLKIRINLRTQPHFSTIQFKIYTNNHISFATIRKQHDGENINVPRMYSTHRCLW